MSDRINKGSELVIIAGQDSGRYLKDLFLYKELLFFLCWRDILVRYKQTYIGIAWALIKPLITLMIFVFVFNRVAGLPSQGDAPYGIMVFSAMLPWQVFISSFSMISDSLVSNSALVSKVYFPKIVLPLSSVAVNFVDAIFSLALMFVMVVFFEYPVRGCFLYSLPLLMFASFVAIGPGLILCSANVRYRDVRHAIPFVSQLGMYISPVGYSSSLVPENWRLIYEINPMVGVIDGFRWAILHNAPFPFRSLLISLGVSFICLFFGIKAFRATENTFADTV